MNSKNNRTNHDFQIAYFLAGSCHTPDGAYSLLCDLREDRKAALAFAKADDLRAKAKLVRALIGLNSTDEATRLDAEADIAEAEAGAEVKSNCLAAAAAELATIENYIAQLQPQRRFADLPDPEAHEAAQFEEWRLELIHRAENSLIACGSLNPDLLATMRMHPAFHSDIWPAVCALVGQLKTDKLSLQPKPALIEYEATKINWQSSLC